MGAGSAGFGCGIGIACRGRNWGRMGVRLRCIRGGLLEVVIGWICLFVTLFSRSIFAGFCEYKALHSSSSV